MLSCNISNYLIKHQSERYIIIGNKINTSMSKEYNGNSIIKQEESAMVFEQSKNPKKKFNPMDKQGKITRCVICNSKIHWGKH